MRHSVLLESFVMHACGDWRSERQGATGNAIRVLYICAAVNRLQTIHACVISFNYSVSSIVIASGRRGAGCQCNRWPKKFLILSDIYS